MARSKYTSGSASEPYASATVPTSRVWVGSSCRKIVSISKNAMQPSTMDPLVVSMKIGRC